MKKRKILLSLIIGAITLSGCSSNKPPKPTQSPTSLALEATKTPDKNKKQKSFATIWKDFESKYPKVSYSDIKSGKYKDSHVIIDGIITNVDYIFKDLYYDIFYEVKGGYHKEELQIIDYSDTVEMKQMHSLKNGYKVRFCTYINEDNDFDGDDILSLKILKKKKANIKKFNIVNKDDLIEDDEFDWPFYDLKYNKLLDVKISGKTLIIKAKLNPKRSNRDIINSCYFDVIDVIQNEAGKNYKEIQYWAVADMTDGSEQKVISFTLKKKTIQGIYQKQIFESNLDNYLSDLYIHPTLK